MCLNTRSMLTTSKYINTNMLGTKIINSFNCGCCYECQQYRQMEYYIRSKAEFESCINKGGFAFVDCLTYAPSNLPVFQINKNSGDHVLYRGEKYFINNDDINSIKCFNRKDITDFFKRLRINLTRSGYDVKDNLRYFLVSEYGGSLSRRPHYHFILYCNIPNLSYTTLNYIIYNSWNLGITDMDHSPSEKVIDGFGAISYVSKYIIKDSDYMEELNTFITSNNLSKKEITQLQPFHRQSLGFGLTALGDQDYNKLFETNKLSISDNHGYHEISIPTYFKRKLWYYNEKDNQGAVHWYLTDEGVRWFKHTLYKNTLKLSNRYSCVLNDIQNESPILYSKLVYLLNNRTTLELAKYVNYYFGRLLPNYIKYKPKLFDMVEYLSNELYTFDYNYYFNVSRFSNSYNSLSDSLFTFDNDSVYNVYNLSFSKNHFINAFSINQNSFSDFKNFDEIVSLINEFTHIKSIKLEKERLEKMKEKSRLKAFTHKKSRSDTRALLG